MKRRLNVTNQLELCFDAPPPEPPSADWTTNGPECRTGNGNILDRAPRHLDRWITRPLVQEWSPNGMGMQGYPGGPGVPMLWVRHITS